MRILHIIATLDRQAGGPSHSVRGIIAAYPAIGATGEVLTLDDPAAPFLRKIDGERTCRVHALGPVSTRFGYNRRLIPWLRANRDRYDGFVLHGLWQYLGWSVRRTIYHHKPYVIFPHGMLDPYFKRAFPFKHLKKSLYWLVNEYWVLKNARGVLFTSDAESDRATESFWPSSWNAIIVPYGASAPQGDPVALRKTFLDGHPTLKNADGTPRRFLLFLGRLHAKKGCDLLLEAFLRIAEKVPNLDLVFAGPEKSTGNVGLSTRLSSVAAAKGIGHRVHWTGMLYGDQKWGAFYACEAFCLPSHQENFGVAVAEALACGKPVLLSDKVNIWQDIVHDGAGLAGPDTAAGTLRTLEAWIALTPDEKDIMGARARKCFHRRYDMHANAAGILKIFSQALSETALNPARVPTTKASPL